MTKPRMPTTLPSPADRGEFRFAAVDSAGAVWRWVDEEMVWVRVETGAEPDGAGTDACGNVH